MRKPVEHGDVGGQVEGVNLHTGQVPACHIQLLRVPAGNKSNFLPLLWFWIRSNLAVLDPDPEIDQN
jgi:hypothetical protein